MVDMLYFPFFEFTWPDWVPVIGGTDYEFFAYIFNVADAAICVGVFLLILFYSRDTGIAYTRLTRNEEKTGKNKD